MPVRRVAIVQNGKSYPVGDAVIRESHVQSFYEAITGDRGRPLGEYAAASVGVYACVHARAQNVARLPLRLWKTSDQGIKTPVRSGGLFGLLNRVNPYWTGKRLWYATEQAMGLYGESFWALVPDKKTKRPKEIWWLHPGRMRVVPDTDDYIGGYKFSYRGHEIPFRADEIIWIPYHNTENEFQGLSPLRAALLSVDTSIDAMLANRKFFKNGMHLGGIISPKDEGARFTKDQIKQLEEDLSRRFAGADKAHKWMVMSGALDAKTISVPAKDAEFISQLQWSLNDICRAYQVPPPIVQDFSQTKQVNIEPALKAFWTLCVLPETEFLASEMVEKLLPLFPGEADTAEFDASQIRELQEDQTEITFQAQMWHQIGVPLNSILHHYKPEFIPEGTSGFPWGDEPPAVPGVTGLGQPGTPANPNQPDPVDRPKKPTLLGLSEGPMYDPAWRDTAKGRAYLAAVNSPPIGKDSTLLDLLKTAKGQLATLKADQAVDIPFGSEQHEAIMAAIEAGIMPLEQQAISELVTFFGEQAADMANRLRQIALPTKAADDATWQADFVSQIPQGERRDDDEAWLLLALLLLHRAYPVGTESAWSTWELRLRDRLMPIAMTAGQHGAASAATDMGLALDRNALALLDAHIEAWAKQRSVSSARAINATTWGRMQQIVADELKDGATIEDIVSALDDSLEIRAAEAARIAATEVFSASNEGRIRVYETAGVLSLVWLTRLDNRVRDAHRRLHGQSVPPGEYFEIASGMYTGYRARGPGQFGVAALDVGCRCLAWSAREQSRSLQPIANGNGRKDVK